ncbi:MAG: glycosyltransferase family 39 protein [Anaerolineae bacterium]|nr:glycosyltransferase family 39 protein [Anaerolineae bacterium]
MKITEPSFPWRPLLLVLLVALIARALLLASGAVSFHADEAVVGLMARHILQGERPTFFYGQAYMGSLDAWMIALGFRLLGESVLTIRIVQSALYLLVVAAGYVTAWRLSQRIGITVFAGLMQAIPAANTALYTTATLGGYNETLIFGSLMLALGYDVTHDYPRSAWRWALLGVCAGLGWWTNGLIVVYVLPVAALILYRIIYKPLAFSPQPSGEIVSSRVTKFSVLSTQYSVLPYLILALIAFFIGSAPWWIFDFTNDHAALATYLTNRQSGEFAGIGLPYIPPPQRAIGLLFIGLPTLIGLRFPWSPDYVLLPFGILVALIYIVALFRLARRPNPLQPDAHGLVLGMLSLFVIVFVASTFGADPTGRYFLPLILPLSIALATLQLSVKKFSLRTSVFSVPLGLILLAFVVIFHAAGQFIAASNPPGFTTQFDPVSHIANDHDAELIAFLDEHQLYNGYTNYWVAFRLAFLTSERMQYSAALPYKTSLDYNPADNRYPVYAETTDTADRIAFITTKLPELDAQLEQHFAAQGLTYQQKQIGDFIIYYDFLPNRPDQID